MTIVYGRVYLDSDYLGYFQRERPGYITYKSGLGEPFEYLNLFPGPLLGPDSSKRPAAGSASISW